MKFLLDAGVPLSIQDFLMKSGNKVLRISQVNLTSVSDREISLWAQRNKSVIVTRDKGFGDIREYPPDSYYGIIVIRDLNLNALKITKIFKKAWLKIKNEEIKGKTIIITKDKVRIRKI